MTGAALRSVAVHLPETSVAVADLPELADLDDVERTTLLGLGIDRVTCDGGGAGTVGLAERAARDALGQAGLCGADLDALVLVESRVPASFMVSEVTRLQAALDAGRAVVFSVGGLGCASLGPALLAARGLLADGRMASVLVAHGCGAATPRRYRHPVTVGGDAGMAAVVGREGPLRLLDVVQETSGDYWDLFRVDYRDRPSADWREVCANVPRYTFDLAMETRGRLRRLYRELLERHGLDRDAIACHVMQNLSLGAFDFCEQSLGIRIDPACRETLARCGHLGPIDVLLDLKRALEAGRVRQGDRAVLISASPVAAWSLLLVEVAAGPPDRTVYL